jgi:cyclic lactone autoinducer peptide
MKLKKSLLNAIAQIGYKSAIKAGGTASQYGIYQAKEPIAVSKIRNKRMHI